MAESIGEDKPVQVVFFGSDKFSVLILDRILNQIRLPLVVSIPDKKAGRGQVSQANDVVTFCRKRALPFVCPENLREKDFQQRLVSYRTAFFVVASYGRILPSEILSIPQESILNVHPSLLPRWRGPSPIQAALLNGDSETGVSIMRVTKKLDAGDILLQEVISIDPSIDAQALEEQLAYVGATLLIKSFGLMRGHQCKWLVQDDSRVVYSRKLCRTDGLVDWRQGAVTIHNQIRAFYPWPGSFSYLGGKRIKLFFSSPGKLYKRETVPGKILEVAPEGWMSVATADGEIIINEIQMEGKKRQSPFQVSLGYPLKGRVFAINEK